MVVFPGDCPVTTPVLLTVAIAAFPDTHGLTVAAVAVPESVVVSPLHEDNVPEIDGDVLAVNVKAEEYRAVQVPLDTSAR